MSSWIERAVNYQINLRSIAAREPRNALEAAGEKAGGPSALAYLTEHLPALQQLGVGLLHLMPPFSIGVEGRKGIGSPYAARDYLAVEAEYGTREELASFVRRAHSLGFRVIFGMVPNHTARDHRWTREHPEYYVQGEDGSPAYDLDWADTAKLDYRQPGLREAMLEVYDHWLGFLGELDGQPDGVDGFRIDMAHFINDRGFWDEALPELRRRHPERELLFLAECYGLDNNLDLFQRGFNAAYDDTFYKCCEYFYGVDGNLGSVVLEPAEEARHNGDFAEALAAHARGGIAAAFGQCIAAYADRFPPTSPAPRVARYIDNHDEGRGLYRFGEGAARAVSSLIFLSPNAIPFLLTGQEFGALNRPSIHERIQPCDKGRRRVSCGRERKEPGVEFEGNLFARGTETRQSLYRFYRELIALRQREPALQSGTYTPLDPGEQAPGPQRSVIAFRREYEGQGLICAVNLGDQPRRLEYAQLFAGEVVHGSLQPDGTLPPFGTLVVRG